MSILDRFSLKGKVALVTGATGKYGRQIALALVEAGAKTYIGSRSISSQLQFVDEMHELGYELYPLKLDQGEEDQILAVRDQILSQSGRIDILVNNAVARPMKNWSDPVEKFAESMRINATGIFMMTRAFGDEMAHQGSGSIIQIGSIMGMIAPDGTLYESTSMNGFVPDYFFHKGGMINFTRMVAAQYGPAGVRCNCISPGGTGSAALPDVFVKRYCARTLLGRMAGPEDLMGTVVFLASDASEYLTGINIPVDGGYTAK